MPETAGRLPGPEDADRKPHTGRSTYLCFWMVHETPDQAAFFSRLLTFLNPESVALVAEPDMHVTGHQLDQSVLTAKEAGSREEDRPRIRFCRSVVLRR